MKKKKLRLIQEEKDNLESLTIRLSKLDRQQAQKAANRYTEGNISEYIRYAVRNFVPGEEDLTEGNA